MIEMISLAVALLTTSAPPFVESSGHLAWVSTTTTTPDADARLFAAVRDAFERRTSLRVVRGRDIGLDEAALRNCGGRFVCWLDVVDAAPSTPAQVLVTARAPFDDRTHRVLAALLDPELGRLAREAARERAPDDPKVAEALVFEDAILTHRYVQDVGAVGDAERLAKDFAARCKGHLVQARRWAPSSTLLLRLPPEAPEALELRLDDVPLSVGGGTTRLDRVRPGAHALVLTASDGRFVPLSTEIDVPTSTVAHVDLSSPKPATAARAIRQTARWSGVALVGAGLALVIHAAAVSLGEPDEILTCTAPCPSEPGFRRLGPFLEAPLGYSMMTAGATWTAGSFLEGPAHEPPVWSIVLGAVLAGTAYGLSVAFDKPRP